MFFLNGKKKNKQRKELYLPMRQNQDPRWQKWQRLVTVFKNGHLRDFIAACVKLETIKQYDPNETAGVRQMPPLNGQMPILIDVKAKDAVKNAEKEVDTQSKFLIAIEKVGEQF